MTMHDHVLNWAKSYMFRKCTDFCKCVLWVKARFVDIIMSKGIWTGTICFLSLGCSQVLLNPNGRWRPLQWKQRLHHAATFTPLLTPSVPLTEHLHHRWPVSLGTLMFVIMAAPPLSFFCSCFADLTFHCPFVYVCVCVFVREGRWRGLYDPPGSCKRWLMEPRCSRCNSSFSR